LAILLLLFLNKYVSFGALGVLVRCGLLIADSGSIPGAPAFHS
jgi:hypothetical protein